MPKIKQNAVFHSVIRRYMLNRHFFVPYSLNIPPHMTRGKHAQRATDVSSARLWTAAWECPPPLQPLPLLCTVTNVSSITLKRTCLLNE